MPTAQQPKGEGDVWEPRKAEIGWLYQRMTLKAVKEHMERAESFPDYSLSMWKKKVGQWGLDNKHNKRSTIEAAAEYFRETPTSQRCNPFALSNGKIISEAELWRYLQRSKTVLHEGKLKLRGALSSATTPALQRLRPSTSVEAAPQIPPPSASEATADQYAAKKSRALLERKKAIFQHRKNLRRAKVAYLFGQGIICAADLAVPEIYQHHHTIFKGITDYTQSSWFAGLWFVDGEGYPESIYEGASPALDRFIYCYQAAAHHYNSGDIAGCRRSLWKASEALLYCVQSGMPEAILWAFKESAWFLERSAGVAQAFLSPIAHLLSSTSGVYPGVQRLFSSLSSIPRENFHDSVLLGLQVWSESLINDDIHHFHPNWSAQRDAWKIQYNTSLASEERADKLLSHTTFLVSDISVHPTIIFRIILETTVSLLSCQNSVLAELAIKLASDVLEFSACSQNDTKQQERARLKMKRSELHFMKGNIQVAISEQEEALQMLNNIESSTKVAAAKYLAEMYSEQNDLRRSQQAEDQYWDMMHDLEALSLDDIAWVNGEVGSSPFGTFSGDDDASISGKADSAIFDHSADASINAEKAWESYVNGENYEMNGAAESPTEWRKEVSVSKRNHLTLCGPLGDGFGGLA